jgi:signal peptidase I
VGFVLLAVRSSVVGAFRIAGACDAPTLLNGDRVLVNRAAYDLRVPFASWTLARRGNPQRGDLVLCHVRGKEGLLIKRVIGVGGDVIALRDNHLSVNGEPATYDVLEAADFAAIAAQNRVGDRFARERIAGLAHLISYNSTGRPLSNFGPFTVPEGEYFLLGDNRDNSYDSRHEACGCVPRDWILGRMIGDGRTGP